MPLRTSTTAWTTKQAVEDEELELIEAVIRRARIVATETADTPLTEALTALQQWREKRGIAE